MDPWVGEVKSTGANKCFQWHHDQHTTTTRWTGESGTCRWGFATSTWPWTSSAPPPPSSTSSPSALTGDSDRGHNDNDDARPELGHDDEQWQVIILMMFKTIRLLIGWRKTSVSEWQPLVPHIWRSHWWRWWWQWWQWRQWWWWWQWWWRCSEKYWLWQGPD